MANGIQRWKAPTGRQNFIKLDLNEGEWDDFIIQKIQEKFDIAALSSYPEYDSLLRELSIYVDAPSSNIALTNGADQAIQLVAQHIIQHRRILLPCPVFSFYRHSIDAVNADIIPVPYLKTGTQFVFPIEDLLEKIKWGDAIILCSPNNPLGSELTSEDFERIMLVAKKKNCLVIIDISYAEYSLETTHLTNREDVIYISTFSKVFSMAGLRLGYIVAKPEIIDVILGARGPWDVNAAATQVGTFLLGQLDLFRTKIKKSLAIKQELELFAQKNGINIFMTHTNFSLFQVKRPKEFVCYLRKNGILVTPMENYSDNHGLMEGLVRISIPLERDILNVTNVISRYSGT